MKKLLRYSKDKTIILLDCETLNLNLCTTLEINAPWQTSLLITKNGKIEREVDLFTKWLDDNGEAMKIGDGAAKVTQFYTRKIERFNWRTMEEVLEDEGEEPEETFKKLNPVLQEADYIVGHNLLGFDQYLIMGLFERVNASWQSIVDKMIDTMAIGRGITSGNIYNSEQNFQAWQYKMINSVRRVRGKHSCSLQNLCKVNKIDFDPDKMHDGLEDLKANFGLWEKYKWQIEI